MNQNVVNFEISDNRVNVQGYPTLEGREGHLVGDGMAFFYGEGYGNQEVYVANTLTGKIRQLSTSGGKLLVDDDEIDYESIAKTCRSGLTNAKNKAVRYAGLCRWGDFKNGICAMSWMLYPEGYYFADSDGFGVEPDDEEVVYAIINANLEIIEQFRPIQDVDKYLEEMRES